MWRQLVQLVQLVQERVFGTFLPNVCFGSQKMRSEYFSQLHAKIVRRRSQFHEHSGPASFLHLFSS
jgi:hypothetical protein